MSVAGIGTATPQYTGSLRGRWRSGAAGTGTSSKWPWLRCYRGAAPGADAGILGGAPDNNVVLWMDRGIFALVPLVGIYVVSQAGYFWAWFVYQQFRTGDSSSRRDLNRLSADTGPVYFRQ